MPELTECDRLKAQLVALKNARATGVASIRTPEGRAITYRSGTELEAAIVALESEIATVCGIAAPTRRRVFRMTQTGNGY